MPVQLFGKMLAFSRLKLDSDDLDIIKNSLKQLSPVVKTTPVVIDSSIKLDLTALIELLWAHKLSVIGVIDGALNDQAQTHKLAIFPNDGTRMERLVARHPESSNAQAGTKTTTKDSQPIQKTKADLDAKADDKQAGAQATPQTDNDTSAAGLIIAKGHQGSTHLPSAPTSLTASVQRDGITSIVHDQMLRSGQTLYHFGGDLIITKSVNNGAEVITDNNLHIYGKASGRLIAGATGDQAAQIFCQKFDPTLVSVAGTYCLRDDIPDELIGKAVQVSYMAGKGLVFKLLDA